VSQGRRSIRGTTLFSSTLARADSSGPKHCF